MKAVPGHTNLVRRGAVYYHRCKVPTDIVESYGRREVTYSLKTTDLTEAVRRVKVAAVETMKRFDDHRRKVTAEKVVAEKAAEVRAVESDPIDPFLAAGEAMAANDGADARAELVAYSTLANSQLDLFAELHRSIRLADDEEERFDGFKAVRPGPGRDMWLLAADEKRLAGKRTHATEYALAESKARALARRSILRTKLARGQYDGVAVYVEDCLAAAGITFGEASRAWRSLLQRVQVAEVPVMADIEAHNEGKEPGYRGSDEIFAEITASRECQEFRVWAGGLNIVGPSPL